MMILTKLSLDLRVFDHEFRTPLAVILGSLGFIEKELLSKSQQQYLYNIEESAKRLLKMVQDLAEKDLKKNDKKSAKPTVLMVEDNLLIQSIHCQMLEAMGCLVETAACGEEALIKLDRSYDLIFLDIGLPGMSGVELAKHIRARSRYQHTRLIALTAYTDLKTRQDCIDAGIKEVAYKPISAEDLEILVFKNNEPIDGQPL